MNTTIKTIINNATKNNIDSKYLGNALKFIRVNCKGRNLGPQDQQGILRDRKIITTPLIFSAELVSQQFLVK